MYKASHEECAVLTELPGLEHQSPFASRIPGEQDYRVFYVLSLAPVPGSEDTPGDTWNGMGGGVFYSCRGGRNREV